MTECTASMINETYTRNVFVDKVRHAKPEMRRRATESDRECHKRDMKSKGRRELELAFCVGTRSFWMLVHLPIT